MPFDTGRDRSPGPGAGASLHVRIHRAAGARSTVLLFQGNGEVVADYDDSAGLYARAGVALAVMDYRGYGASSGTPTLRSALTTARLVLEAVRRWLGERGLAGSDGAPSRLVVMGRSLGSACAAELYGARPNEVAGFILESGSSDLAALVRRRGLVVPNDLSPDARTTLHRAPWVETASLRCVSL